MDPYQLFSTPPNDLVVTSTPIKSNKRCPKKGTKKKDENIWDKCIKTNPELDQFIQNFNTSLEEATNKPLKME